MPDIDPEAIEERREAATPRPWRVGEGKLGTPGTLPAIEQADDPHPAAPVAEQYPRDDPESNAALIVAAVNACHALNVAPADLAPNVRALVEALEQVLLNGVQHYKNDLGKCYRTCVGCPTEELVRAALVLFPEAGRREAE